jgi:hypothetical protein
MLNLKRQEGRLKALPVAIEASPAVLFDAAPGRFTVTETAVTGSVESGF